MDRQDAIEQLAQLLRRRRDALNQALDGDSSLLEEMAEELDGDIVDFASDSASHEVNSQLAAAQREEISAIEDTFKRMKLGSYGLCEHCDAKVPMPRLEALPYTTTCIRCAQAIEEGLLDDEDSLTSLPYPDPHSSYGDVEYYEA
ncbi:Molecular chaperone DnaK [Planctomycetales bacterium 10988]|nr:Molecular chaperone DnaK [Planctomycetales bacterium 10988]